MPYKPKQATAIFLDIKRRKGLDAAKAFGRKHSDDLSKSGRAPYRARKSRSK